MKPHIKISPCCICGADAMRITNNTRYKEHTKVFCTFSKCEQFIVMVGINKAINEWNRMNFIKNKH